MKSILWIGDAACDTGFSRGTHKILDVVCKDARVAVLGINYMGDPTPYDNLYDIYPAFSGGDLFGVGRVKELCDKLNPDMVVIQNDPWNFAAYLKYLKKVPFVVGIVAVDGLNCRGAELNNLDAAIFWTKFGLDQARAGGYKRPAAVIPLGVDLDIYNVQNRLAARKQLLPEVLHNKFIIGNVNRNQPRKRMDLTIQAFAKWLNASRVDDAYLYLHAAPTGDAAYDCNQLAKYYGVVDRLILAEPAIFKGITEERLAKTYACFDVQLTTSIGEGMGLTTLEGMACGIPQIGGAVAALGEWASAAMYPIRCPTTYTTPDGINTIMGVPDVDEIVNALNAFYYDERQREDYAAKGLRLALQPKYRWENVGRAYAAAFDEVYDERVCQERRQSSWVRGGSNKAQQPLEAVSDESRQGGDGGNDHRDEREHAADTC